MTQDTNSSEGHSDQAPKVQSERKKSKALQRMGYDDNDSDEEDFVMPKPRKNRRMVPVHQSRIADRPTRRGAEDSSLKIKIELDLEVEVIHVLPIPELLFLTMKQVEIYARVKGDVTIGLM